MGKGKSLNFSLGSQHKRKFEIKANFFGETPYNSGS